MNKTFDYIAPSNITVAYRSDVLRHPLADISIRCETGGLNLRGVGHRELYELAGIIAEISRKFEQMADGGDDE